MSITDVKIMTFPESNHVKILVNQHLTRVPKMAFMRGASLDMDNVFYGQEDLLKLCNLSGVEAMYIERDCLVLSTAPDVRWDRLVDNIKDRVEDMTPDADVAVQHGCSITPGYRCIYDLYDQNGA